MAGVGTIKAGVIEIIAIDDRSAMGDVGVVIVEYPVAAPVASPVIPAPPKASEETDSESNSE